MTYALLLARVISDGIEAATADYADRPDHLRGAVDGFEACRDKSPGELALLYQHAERRAHAAACDQAPDYWRWRCFAAEVEWVCNVVSVGLPQPLLAHLPTARGAMKYAEIVGVAEVPRGHD